MTYSVVSNSEQPVYAKRQDQTEEFASSTLTPPFPKVAMIELSNAYGPVHLPRSEWARFTPDAAL